MIYNFNNKRIKLNHFFETLQLIKENKIKFQINKNILTKIKKDFACVKQSLNSGQSVYGMNTGLGSNLNYKLKNENECHSAKVIATGGYSQLFKHDIKCIDHFEEDLTLEGLILINQDINE